MCLAFAECLQDIASRPEYGNGIVIDLYLDLLVRLNCGLGHSRAIRSEQEFRGKPKRRGEAGALQERGRRQG